MGENSAECNSKMGENLAECKLLGGIGLKNSGILV
jgi:hypothetical protein